MPLLECISSHVRSVLSILTPQCVFVVSSSAERTLSQGDALNKVSTREVGLEDMTMHSCAFLESRSFHLNYSSIFYALDNELLLVHAVASGL